MKRLTILLTLVFALLALACEPNDWLAGLMPPENGDDTEQPTPTSTPTPEPEPVEVTATLTYAECKSAVQGYGKEATYTNEFGTWVVCAYDNSDSMQLNSGKVAYIGTPTFEGDITKVILTFSDATRSGDILLCTEKGTTAVSGQFESFGFGGSASEHALTTAGVKRLYIRASACARISSVTIVAGGKASSGGGGETPEPDPTPDPTPDPDEPGSGVVLQRQTLRHRTSIGLSCQ